MITKEITHSVRYVWHFRVHVLLDYINGLMKLVDIHTGCVRWIQFDPAECTIWPDNEASIPDSVEECP